MDKGGGVVDADDPAYAARAFGNKKAGDPVPFNDAHYQELIKNYSASPSVIKFGSV